MYVIFRTKWSKLYCGSLGSAEPTEQGGRGTHEVFNPITVCTYEELVIITLFITPVSTISHNFGPKKYAFLDVPGIYSKIKLKT